MCPAFLKAQKIQPRHGAEISSSSSETLGDVLSSPGGRAGDLPKRLQFHTCSVRMKVLPDI